jgi:large subunit ribosomal protein L31
MRPAAVATAKEFEMKKNLHPQSQKVVFQDMMTGEQFLIDSLVQTAETILWEDGNSYPLLKVEISSSSHPVYTGKAAVEVTSTRREKFDKKYSKRESMN